MDASHDLDLVTVFRTASTISDFEAMSVKALLESNGITAVIIGDSRYPNLPDEVRVARADADRAKTLIDEAIAAGPEAADAAERETEG
jgi:hypothetical protein